MKYYVAQMRSERDLTLRKLSELSGVSKSHIQRIEANEARPSLEVMCRLAYALKCPVTDLFATEWPRYSPHG